MWAVSGAWPQVRVLRESLETATGEDRLRLRRAEMVSVWDVLYQLSCLTHVP